MEDQDIVIPKQFAGEHCSPMDQPLARPSENIHDLPSAGQNYMSILPVEKRRDQISIAFPI
jgi:hypothetical protein